MIDTVGMQRRNRLNVDHLIWSTDYPHSGSNWPNSRAMLDKVFRGVPRDEVKKMLCDNVRVLHNLDGIPERVYVGRRSGGRACPGSTTHSPAPA